MTEKYLVTYRCKLCNMHFHQAYFLPVHLGEEHAIFHPESKKREKYFAVLGNGE